MCYGLFVNDDTVGDTVDSFLWQHQEEFSEEFSYSLGSSAQDDAELLTSQQNGISGAASLKEIWSLA